MRRRVNFGLSLILLVVHILTTLLTSDNSTLHIVSVLGDGYSLLNADISYFLPSSLISDDCSDWT